MNRYQYAFLYAIVSILLMSLGLLAVALRD
ncbi:Uncharacterised protein [Bacteroides salyersiae]|jgi:hypothetical protein|nr:Uncharacterised protein [Bacteroides salyersiae]DAU01556.1 MAG TPA: hypothetical protein [Caudoviricetes sp.]